MAGLVDKIQTSTGAFVGGGEYNIISDLPPYYNSNLSAIAGGIANIVGSPDSFIGAGQANTIIPPAVKLANGDSPSSFIGSGEDNTIASDYSVVTGGYSNSVSGEFGTVSGGLDNSVSGLQAVVMGGYENAASGANSAIVGGSTNVASAAFSAVAGGYNNSVSGTYSVVPGGSNNTITGSTASIGGGYRNSATALYATIPGGTANLASGFSAVTAGGSNNTASGRQAAVPGGERNIAAGQNSFAAGTASNAATQGAFVWSDNATGATTLKSSASNQFLARASGGFYLYSSASLKAGVELAPGSGAWSSLSDRNVKNNVRSIDAAQILARLDAMPVSEWSYNSEGSIRHLGPMAQDFRAAFGLGEDDRHISTVDEEGVALAAIKALQSEVAEKDAQIVQLRHTQADADRRLETIYKRLEQRLDVLEGQVNTAQ